MVTLEGRGRPVSLGITNMIRLAFLPSAAALAIALGGAAAQVPVAGTKTMPLDVVAWTDREAYSLSDEIKIDVALQNSGSKV